MKKLSLSFIRSYLSSSRQLNSVNQGLTLTELLIALVIVPVVVLTASQIFISQVRSERALLGGQSSENLRSRLSFLLESDIADGEKILITSDDDCASIANQLFIVKSPYLDSSELLQYSCIYYTQIGGNLFRTGPPILTNGSLDNGATSLSQQVAAGVQISNIIVSDSATKVDFNIGIPGFLGLQPKIYAVAYGTKNFRVGT